MFNVPASQTTDKLLLNSINKIQLKSDGEKEIDLISVSQALQIAGRAGRFVLPSFEFRIFLNFKFRFNTKWETGYVTTFHQEELHVLADLLKQTPEDILQVLCSAYEHHDSDFRLVFIRRSISSRCMPITFLPPPSPTLWTSSYPSPHSMTPCTHSAIWTTSSSLPT